MKKIARIIVVFACTCLLYAGYAQAANASYAVVDGDTGRLLLGSNPHSQAPIASLTKMWTALVAIENSNLDDEVTVSREAAYSEGSSIYLEEGEKVKVETLLYGLMLRSGNDAAWALAEHAGSSVDGFVHLMNEKAYLYGLNNTYFTNPSGLHHDLHLSSAYDTAQMLRIALENEEFRKIASTIHYKADTINGTTWENKHRLIREQSGAVAGKTGYTKVAGRTLATYFEDGDKKVIVVTINESNDWQVHKQLAQRVFNNYDIVTIADRGKYKVTDDKSVSLKEPIKLLVNEEEENEIKNVLHLSRNEDIKFGNWHIFLNNQRIYSTKVTLN